MERRLKVERTEGKSRFVQDKPVTIVAMAMGQRLSITVEEARALAAELAAMANEILEGR